MPLQCNCNLELVGGWHCLIADSALFDIVQVFWEIIPDEMDVLPCPISLLTFLKELMEWKSREDAERAADISVYRLVNMYVLGGPQVKYSRERGHKDSFRFNQVQ